MIAVLTSLRFLVIVLIYFHHLNYPGGLGPGAVTFFFALSGFVMAYSYDRKFFPLNTEQLKSFYVKRLSRLYPLYILTFLISIPIVFQTHFETNVFSALINLFMLQSYFPNGIQVFAFNSLAWFLSDLMLFYFLTPFALFFLHKYPLAGHFKTLLLLLGMLFISEIAIAYHFRHGMEAYSFGWWLIYISPYFRIFDYLIGMVSGLIFIEAKRFFSDPHTVLNQVLFSGLEVISVLLFAYSFYWVNSIPYPSLQMGAAFIPFCILAIFVFALQRGFISLILSTKFFVYLGDLSFSIFMIHQLAISYVAVFFASPIFGMTPDLVKTTSQLLLLFVVICLSDVSTRYFEQPMRNWIIHVAETKMHLSIRKSA